MFRKMVSFVMVVSLLAGVIWGWTGCGAKAGKTVLVLGELYDCPELEQQVLAFNAESDHVEIEIRQYESLLDMQKEMAAGKGPDLIQFGRAYTGSAVSGTYMTNLYELMDADGAFDKEDYFMNIFDAFAQGNSLYALPVNFSLRTFAGLAEICGSGDHWNMQELMDCFENRPAGTMLYPGETKKDVFGTLCTGNLESFIDWQAGTCRFEEAEFEKLLCFSDRFPEGLVLEEDFSVKEAFWEGKAMLMPVWLNDVCDISIARVFGERKVNFIGFPVEEGCGTVAEPGNLMIGICAGGKHQEAAWQFVKTLLQEEFQSGIQDGFPVNREVFATRIEEAERVREVPLTTLSFEGEEGIPVYAITKEEGEQLLALVSNVTLNSSVDWNLYQILLEEADSFFAHQKTAAEAAAVMQKRASLYISERK